LKVELEKRLFIGIPIGREIQPIFYDIQSSLKHHSEQIRWVPPGNIHITLSFLGNVPMDNIPKLTKVLKYAVNLNYFRVTIEKTGVFPSEKNPKILWLGVANGKEEMLILHKQIEKLVVSFKTGRKKEHFIPHITIGRKAQHYRNINFLPFLKYVYSPIEFDVNSVALYESRLLHKGSKYKVLTKFLLN